MDVSSASAREKVRRLDSLLKELVSTSDNMRLAVLCTLPEEIILSFLQLACYDFWSIVKVSLVCKKFRHIKLSSSKLWAKCLLTLNTSVTACHRHGRFTERHQWAYCHAKVFSIL